MQSSKLGRVPSFRPISGKNYYPRKREKIVRCVPHFPCVLTEFLSRRNYHFVWQ